jgi:predicted GIY-YIG superfamily endonuclease
MSAYVYRVLDEDGLLLYVGCSVDVDRRMGQHRKASPWFAYADQVAVEGPFPRAEALRRESDAIRSERPWFNGTPEQLAEVGRWRGTYLRAVYSGTGRDVARYAADEAHGPCPDTEWRHGRYLAHFALPA